MNRRNLLRTLLAAPLAALLPKAKAAPIARPMTYAETVNAVRRLSNSCGKTNLRTKQFEEWSRLMADGCGAPRRYTIYYSRQFDPAEFPPQIEIEIKYKRANIAFGES